MPRLLISPLEGLMDGLFFAAMGNLDWATSFTTPFFRVSTAVPGNRAVKKFLAPVKASGKLFTVQLMGTDPELIAQSAEMFRQHGAAGIDLNFACPVKRVVNNGGGGAMLGNPQQMLKIITATAKALDNKCPLSVKLRAGLKSPDEMKSFLPPLSNAPLDFAVMHFRTVNELYEEVSGREIRLQRAAELLEDLPMLGGGDIFSENDADTVMKIAGCHGIALGRGILRDPLLFKRLENPAAAYPDVHYARITLFNKLIELTQDQQNVHKANLVALGRFMFGEKSHEFTRLKATFKHNSEFQKLEL